MQYRIKKRHLGLLEAWTFCQQFDVKQFRKCEKYVSKYLCFFFFFSYSWYCSLIPNFFVVHNNIFHGCLASKLSWKLQVKSELPSNLKTYRHQQHRWTCGAANLFRKVGAEILFTKVTLLVSNNPWYTLNYLVTFFLICMGLNFIS